MELMICWVIEIEQYSKTSSFSYLYLLHNNGQTVAFCKHQRQTKTIKTLQAKFIFAESSNNISKPGTG